MSKRDLWQEIRKTLPVHSLEREVNLNIVQTSDQLQSKFAQLFREYGLTSSQYNVLIVLRSEAKPMPCMEVRDRLIQRLPAITGLVDRLEKQGLVSRERCQEDRRVVYIEITNDGQKLLERLDGPVLDLHKQLCGSLSKSELETIVKLMAMLRANMGDEE